MGNSLFWATFVTIFLAELGDKTQLAAMAASARGGSLLTVFLGASAALVAATAIAVLAGAIVFKVVPPQVIRYVAAAGFFAVGFWTLFKG